MVMRSDGGVMDVREIGRRPILTLLSGPAAGIAGALLHERLIDGIFVEVGGTSSDCSAIRAGRPQMRPARIGGHRTTLRTLDVRTLGIGGGSMLRVAEGAIVDVGPRSAHIAGCAYASFVAPELLDGARVEPIAPTPQDRADHVVLVTPDGTRIALTVTCAANVLGDVPEDAFARGNAEAARRAFELLARHLGGDARALAARVLELAVAKLRPAIDALIADYALDRRHVTIVGGGGGCGALVPQLAASDEAATAHRARCRSDCADRRGAGAGTRRRRTHDRVAFAARDREHSARGGRSRHRRGRRTRARRRRGRDRFAAQQSLGDRFGRDRTGRVGGRRGVRRGRASRNRGAVVRVRRRRARTRRANERAERLRAANGSDRRVRAAARDAQIARGRRTGYRATGRRRVSHRRNDGRRARRATAPSRWKRRPSSATWAARCPRSTCCAARASPRTKGLRARTKPPRWPPKNWTGARRRARRAAGGSSDSLGNL